MRKRAQGAPPQLNCHFHYSVQSETLKRVRHLCCELSMFLGEQRDNVALFWAVWLELTEVPHQNTLKTRLPSPPRCVIKTSNHVGLKPQLLRFEEGSSVITPLQLGSINVTLRLDRSGVSPSARRMPIYSRINA